MPRHNPGVALGERTFAFDDKGTIPKNEYALFQDLVNATKTMNEAVIAMMRRYPFLFGRETEKVIKMYITEMDKVAASQV